AIAAPVASSAAGLNPGLPKSVSIPPTTTTPSAGSRRERRHPDDFQDPRRNVTMLLQTVRPNIVQSIRAYRVDDLMKAAQNAGQHFLYANVTTAQSKQDVLDG